MKIALCTTTITIPHVLRLYRAADARVKFFVACDQKTPVNECYLKENYPEHTWFIPVDDQKQWKCSELIGWNSIQRRSIAFLEALRWGADVIVSVDTDDFPTEPAHFKTIETIVREPFNGIELRTDSGWVDPGSLIDPPTPHRGMPVRLDRFFAHPALDRKIGVVASTVLGSCDISAVDRMTGLIKRHSASELARSGVVVDPRRSWTLFNSEAAAFTRAIAPAAMMLPFVGRYDDLFASMIMQRVMREYGYHVHLGPPIVWHEREDRNILKDLANEMYGMEKIQDVARWLDAIQLKGRTVLEDTRTIWNSAGLLPQKTHEAALAYLDDVESVL